MSYAITAPKNRGNWHISLISDADTWTPLCGVKSVQRDTAWFRPDDIGPTFDTFDTLTPAFRCEKCWTLSLRMKYAA